MNRLVWILLLFIAILIPVIMSILMPRKHGHHRSEELMRMGIPNDKTYISMTTIPERLREDWFYNNLVRTMGLPGNNIIVINIPYVSLKGIPYEIPQKILDLQKKNLVINRCTDEGPITKLLPTLRNNDIPDDAPIIVCDDDIVYKENVFLILGNAVRKFPDHVSTMCRIVDNITEGFKGFGFVKKNFTDILDVHIPESCIRIDDDVINNYVVKKDMKVYVIPYGSDNKWHCSFFKDELNNHPDWPELQFDDRGPMKKKCLADINNEN